MVFQPGRVPERGPELVGALRERYARPDQVELADVPNLPYPLAQPAGGRGHAVRAVPQQVRGAHRSRHL
jgi:hypothetical protein